MKNNGNMIRILLNLCIGCGLCIDACPRQAISLVRGRASINRKLCDGCGICLGVCPRGAIAETVPVSGRELAVIVGSLRKKTDGLIGRIEKLRQKKV